jgi:DNA-binding transcriptional regulator YiaG
MVKVDHPDWFALARARAKETGMTAPLTVADEVRESRRKLGLDRTAFGQALGIASPASAYAQVRKWEAGIVEPSDGAKTAMRLLLELEGLRPDPSRSGKGD